MGEWSGDASYSTVDTKECFRGKCGVINTLKVRTVGIYISPTGEIVFWWWCWCESGVGT